MEVFRLSREAFAKPLSGIGASLKGGRCNSIGIEMIYTAQNRSLAMAEVAAHFSLACMPEDYVMCSINIPDTLKIKTIKEQDLPKNWRTFPHPNSTQKFGDKFILENKYVACKIPSAVTKGDYNILINPRHKDFKLIKIGHIEKFPFDERILK